MDNRSKESDSNNIDNYFPQDLGIVILWVVLSDMFVLLPVLNETFLRVVFAWATVLFLPGYVLIAFLFPKKEDLGLIERVALSFGLSAAITPLLGLALNFTPFGIRLIPISLILTLFIFIFSFLAYLKLENIPEEERFNKNFILSNAIKIILSTVRLPQEKLDKALSIIMFFSVAFCVFTLIFVISVPKQGEKFTEFYILNENGTANNYPVNLMVGEKGIININVVSHEHEPAKYNLLIKIDNQTLQEQKISLNHNETWRKNFTFYATDPGTKKLEFLLYKDNNKDNKTYRNLHLWVNVMEKEMEKENDLFF